MIPEDQRYKWIKESTNNNIGRANEPAESDAPWAAMIPPRRVQMSTELAGGIILIGIIALVVVVAIVGLWIF